MRAVLEGGSVMFNGDDVLLWREVFEIIWRVAELGWGGLCWSRDCRGRIQRKRADRPSLLYPG